MEEIFKKNRLRNRLLIAFLIVLGVIIADQSLKYWVLQNMYLGENKYIFGNWFILHFTENNGMAFGLEFGGKVGKLFLTIFRILAVIGIIWFLIKQIKTNVKIGFIICLSMILAGAIGNIIDSVFYGIIFKDLVTYEGGMFMGRVVDMLYFPIIETHYPMWVPKWGGQQFTFFSPVFNIADASISIGVIILLIFQKRFFGAKLEEPLDISEIFEDENQENLAETKV